MLIFNKQFKGFNLFIIKFIHKRFFLKFAILHSFNDVLCEKISSFCAIIELSLNFNKILFFSLQILSSLEYSRFK